MTGTFPGTSPGTGLEALETRTDARFAAVHARFSTVNRQAARLSDQMNGLEGRVTEQVARLDARFRSMEGRFDATDARIDVIVDQLATQRRRFRDAQQRHRLLTLALAVTAATGWALALAHWLTDW